MSATLLLRRPCVTDQEVIEVRCGGCGRPMCFTIEELRDKHTVNCPECAGRYCAAESWLRVSVSRVPRIIAGSKILMGFGAAGVKPVSPPCGSERSEEA
jgi:hypothetical protein